MRSHIRSGSPIARPEIGLVRGAPGATYRVNRIADCMVWNGSVQIRSQIDKTGITTLVTLIELA
jgi:hypothetical protein